MLLVHPRDDDLIQSTSVVPWVVVSNLIHLTGCQAKVDGYIFVLGLKFLKFFVYLIGTLFII